MISTLPPVSFGDLILHHALTRPEKPAIVINDRVVTYTMMAQAILRLDRTILTLGLRQGELICIAVDNPIRHMIIAAALFRSGLPGMSIKRASEVISLGLPIAAFLESPSEIVIPSQRQILVTDDWFEGEPVSFSASPKGFLDDQAICRVALSSGTTGRPKAVGLTLAAFNRKVDNYYQTVGQGGDRILCLPSLTTNWGFSVAAHALFAGKTLFFAEEPRISLQMIALFAVDTVVASTQQLRELVREQTDAPIPCTSLRAVMTAGSLVSQSLMDAARAKICSTIVVQYGSTEAGTTAHATTDRLAGIEGASGHIVPWADVEVVDADDRELGPDIEGTLRVRTNCQGQPFPGPDGHPGFRNGWFYPGDRGSIRSDGLLILTGRSSEIINAEGVKIAPELIEEILTVHPSVLEAVAFGATGDGGFEEIVVAIVARAPVSNEQIIAWCAERGIRVAKLFNVKTLPKTALGKIQRDLLKRQLLG